MKTAPGAGKTTRVEIQWIVTDSHGQETGRVVQINEVPVGQLDQYWGDVAVVVATEAASGVHEVIVNTTNRGGKVEAAKTDLGKPVAAKTGGGKTGPATATPAAKPQ